VIGAQGSPYLERKHWQVDLGFRYQKSDRHFVGIQEHPERLTEQSQVINWIYLADFSATYGLTNRTTISFSLPVLFADRSQPIRVNGVVASRYTTHTRNISDSSLMVRRWLFEPEEHPSQNVSFGIGVKFPTGKNDVTDVFRTSLTTTTVHTVDQSIMPGDGKFGMIVDMQAFKRIWRTTVTAAATYLVNPAETNGVPTARGRVQEAIFSVPDQYLMRVGAAMPVLPEKYGLALSLGGRMEGVPVHDLIGGSEGFRRPGYALSIEPGLILALKGYVFNMTVPVALKRNRLRSVPDIESGTFGDAAFADYLWTFGLSKRF
jgi:hypothetical protein